MAWFGSGFVFQGSHPASGNCKPGVPVEAFQGHVDVEHFLEWQLFRMYGPVHCCGLILSDGVVILPSMLCYCCLLQHPSLAGLSVLLQSGLKSFYGFINVVLATATGDPVHYLDFHQIFVAH